MVVLSQLAPLQLVTSPGCTLLLAVSLMYYAYFLTFYILEVIGDVWTELHKLKPIGRSTLPSNFSLFCTFSHSSLSQLSFFIKRARNLIGLFSNMQENLLQQVSTVESTKSTLL